NFDNRSFRLNFELCVLFVNGGVAGALEEIMQHDWENAREVTGPRQLPFWSRLGEASARLLSPLL
ncbi:MAG: cardiolipin synthase, partial [Arenimonas sp.]